MKVRIHPITYLILLSFLLCGYFNYFLIISFILLMHDVGHLIIMVANNIKVYYVEVLPFGSIIHTNINYNLKSNILFLISISGILMQLILYILFNILFNSGLINEISYNIFLNYNKLIILFNIIPIIPLDGSKLLLSLLERVVPYKQALIIMNVISLIFIFIFILINKVNLNLIMIGIFLFLKTYQEILEHNYIYNKFLLERYLYKCKYRKVKNIKSIKDFFKNKHNFINNKSENKVLMKIFDNKNYFW